MCNDLMTGLLFGPAALGIKKGAQKILKSDSPAPLEPPPLPALPDPETIKSTAKEDARRRALMKSKTILTSGAGVIDDASLQKKRILGG